jgi:hypothetical protein
MPKDIVLETVIYINKSVYLKLEKVINIICTPDNPYDPDPTNIQSPVPEINPTQFPSGNARPILPVVRGIAFGEFGEFGEFGYIPRKFG